MSWISRSDCVHTCAEVKTYCGSFYIFPLKSMFTECAWAVETDVMEGWRLEKRTSSSWLFLTFPTSAEHLFPHHTPSTHVNTVASMNVALVSTWARVHVCHFPQRFLVGSLSSATIFTLVWASFPSHLVLAASVKCQHLQTSYEYNLGPLETDTCWDDKFWGRRLSIFSFSISFCIHQLMCYSFVCQVHVLDVIWCSGSLVWEEGGGGGGVMGFWKADLIHL